MTSLSKNTVKHVAKLAELPLSEKELEKLAPQLSAILDFISKLQSIDTKNVVPTSQVTGLKNVMREDIVDVSRTFSQEKALSNAKGKYNGFFKVPAIFND